MELSDLSELDVCAAGVGSLTGNHRVTQGALGGRLGTRRRRRRWWRGGGGGSRRHSPVCEVRCNFPGTPGSRSAGSPGLGASVIAHDEPRMAPDAEIARTPPRHGCCSLARRRHSIGCAPTLPLAPPARPGPGCMWPQSPSVGERRAPRSSSDTAAPPGLRRASREPTLLHCPSRVRQHRQSAHGMMSAANASCPSICDGGDVS